MHRAFGCSRDPFAPCCDADLFWEDGTRADARLSVEASLRAGRSVWLRGLPGAGRETLLSRVAEGLAADGHPAVAVPERETTADGWLRRVLEATGAETAPAGLSGLELVEAVYGRFIQVFSDAGPCLLVLPAPDLGGPALGEALLLARLRVAGLAVTGVAACGEGNAPQGWDEVFLPGPEPEALRGCLLHRAAACGCPDLLSPSCLDELCRRSPLGFGRAVEEARRAVRRLAFLRVLDGSGAARSGEAPPPEVLDADELSEVDRLLSALGPEDQNPRL